ncbi:MAG: TolC family protein [Phycisphaerales bacterium]|nr:TolC family protein [Phycisphaerales bacterium]
MIGKSSDYVRATSSPDPAARERSREKTPTQYEKDPATTNPATSELSFTPASEARDVEARLTKMWKETGSYIEPAVAKPLIDATVSDPSGAGAPPPPPGGVSPDGQPTIETATPEGPAPVNAMKIDIEAAMKLAQRSAREHKNQEDTYLVSAISLLLERNQWTPRFTNRTNLGVSAIGTDGRYDNAVRLVNDLRVTQRLPYGGQAEAAWVWDATEQLRSSVTDQYQQASRFIASASIPLLKDAGLIAQESLIQAERNLIYSAREYERFRRSFLVDIANDYFQLVQLKSQIANQERSKRSLENLVRATNALFEAGRVKAFDKNIAASNEQSARSSLLSLREQYALTLDRFKVRLGLPVDQVVEIMDLQFEVVEPDIPLPEATELALSYRLDLQNQRDRLDDSRRAVANARNQLLPGLDFNGGVTVPTDSDTREGGVYFDPDETQYNAGLILDLPLDRRDEALRVRQAQIQLERAKRDYERARDDVVVSVRSSLRSIELARAQLQLAEQRVEINNQRLKEQNLKKDIVKPQEIVDSENELLSSENQRDQAKTDLRNAILNYLLASDQLRVNRDGTFERLPGMPSREELVPMR